MTPQTNTHTNNPADVLAIIALGIPFLFAVWLKQRFGLSINQAINLIVGVGILLSALIGFLVLRKRFKNTNYYPKGKLFHLGELHPEHSLLRKKLFSLGVDDFRHALITGVTGCGKSTLIRRFLREILRNEFSFLYIDFKGEAREFEEIKSLTHLAGIEKQLQIFDLSDPEKCATCNFLTLFKDVNETIGFVLSIFDLKIDFFRIAAEEFLRSCLSLLDATGTTRTFVNIEKIYHDSQFRSVLLRKVPANPQESGFFRYFDKKFNQLSDDRKEDRFAGLMAQISALTEGPLRRIFNAEKSDLNFSALFDQNISAIVRVPGEAYGDLSKRIIQAFIGSLPVLLARRRQVTTPKDYFVFMDEQCSYTSETIIDILKKAGSAKVHCILTRQCDGDFNAEGPGYLSKMVSACSLTFTFLILDAETRDSLSKQMGTKKTKKQTWRLNHGQSTGDASERDVQAFNVPPDTFAELNRGECIVSARFEGLNFNRKMKVFQVHRTSQLNSNTAKEATS